jgi:hypothetical protein
MIFILKTVPFAVPEQCLWPLQPRQPALPFSFFPTAASVAFYFADDELPVCGCGRRRPSGNYL